MTPTNSVLIHLLAWLIMLFQFSTTKMIEFWKMAVYSEQQKEPAEKGRAKPDNIFLRKITLLKSRVFTGWEIGFKFIEQLTIFSKFSTITIAFFH